MIRPTRMAAVAIVAGLAVGVTALWPTGRADPAPDPPPRNPATTVGRSSTTLTTVQPADRGTTTAPRPRGAIDVLRAGLEAWGRFAVSGDLAVVEPWFHPDGPQWAQLRSESSTLREEASGPPPYTVTLEQIRTESGEAEVAVLARVVFGRTGEPLQHFSWRIWLRRHGGAWSIWTVEDAGP